MQAKNTAWISSPESSDKELPARNKLKNKPGPEGRRDVSQSLCPKSKVFTSGLCFAVYPIGTASEEKSHSEINVMSCSIAFLANCNIIYEQPLLLSLKCRLKTPMLVAEMLEADHQQAGLAGHMAEGKAAA